MQQDRYDYTSAGFDPFLTRSIDTTGQSGLGADGPPSRSVAFDRQIVSGAVGDTFRVGRVSINGAAGNITADDGENDFFLLGDE